jgi:hypothetical protein
MKGLVLRWHLADAFEEHARQWKLFADAVRCDEPERARQRLLRIGETREKVEELLTRLAHDSFSWGGGSGDSGSAAPRTCASAATAGGTTATAGSSTGTKGRTTS